ncbi:hypothetical protein HYY70_02545 [Candidatus Woesearchaeota archaeon]|nr:hypothetical protein [Candidatus Woesearchaeota archaeon]
MNKKAIVTAILLFVLGLFIFTACTSTSTTSTTNQQNSGNFDSANNQKEKISENKLETKPQNSCNTYTSKYECQSSKYDCEWDDTLCVPSNQSPNTYRPLMCSLTPGIACVDMKLDNQGINGKGRVKLTVLNAMSMDVDVISIDLEDCGNLNVKSKLSARQQQIFTIDCLQPFPKQKFYGQVNTTFKTSTGDVIKGRGMLVAKVE